jgi:hypothetical protein
MTEREADLARRSKADADRAEHDAEAARRKLLVDEGKYVVAEDAARAWGRELAKLMSETETFLFSKLSRQIAEKHGLDWKAVAVEMREAFRQFRAGASEDARARREALSRRRCGPRAGEGRRMSILVDPRALALTAVEIATRPPPPADLNEWAENNIVFGRESPFPGPYRRETIPPVTRILECLGPNHPARTVTVKASAQIFKTTTAQIFIAGSMDFDPCDMGYVHPTHDNALRWARRKWKVMRKQSAVLRRIFGDAKSRDSHDTTLYQETRDGLGSLTISGANSPASLSMASWPKQVQDDLSKWEANDAGDPERQADARSSAFDWAKIFKISTPLRGKTCRISRAYKNGTQERVHLPCPHPECGHRQPLEWKNFQANIDRDHPEAAHFTCVLPAAVRSSTSTRRRCWRLSHAAELWLGSGESVGKGAVVSHLARLRADAGLGIDRARVAVGGRRSAGRAGVLQRRSGPRIRKRQRGAAMAGHPQPRRRHRRERKPVAGCADL